MPISGKQFVSLLQSRGWVVVRIRGSHYIMRSPEGKKVTVPVHGNRDLPPGTLAALLRETGLRRGELP